MSTVSFIGDEVDAVAAYRGVLNAKYRRERESTFGQVVQLRRLTADSS